MRFDDVARPDAVLRIDDRDDVLVGRVDVQELLVAEVLDDVRAGAERAGAGAGLADVEVLGPEARDERLACRSVPIAAFVCGGRGIDQSAAPLELGVVAASADRARR